MYQYITTAKLRVHFKWSPLYEAFLWNDYHPVNFSNPQRTEATTGSVEKFVLTFPFRQERFVP